MNVSDGLTCVEQEILHQFQAIFPSAEVALVSPDQLAEQFTETSFIIAYGNTIERVVNFSDPLIVCESESGASGGTADATDLKSVGTCFLAGSNPASRTTPANPPQ